MKDGRRADGFAPTTLETTLERDPLKLLGGDSMPNCLRFAISSVFALAILLRGHSTRAADEPARAELPGDDAGHSSHGEIFDEGPRQAAYLMGNVGKVHFPVTTKSPEAQQFIDQGVAQLHGFWYFESERSFRQAAALDHDCAMAYWGMALSNMDNAKRGKGFIAEAMKYKKGVTDRETMYLDALEAYFKDDGKKKERGEAYAKALEKILYKFPDDLEAKAFLCLQLWLNKNNGTPITSFLAYDALMQDVLAKEPMHPCHHYVIHLWDYEKAEKALDSASKCGQAAAGIAHMWHMPGHIYSRLNRYHDAAWQQEASARVDYAYMMRDRVLPDRIHNFAHNNEWLIRDLSFVGRIHDAIELARNMIELPRHPKYNTLSKGSSYFGRMRLYELLVRYEQWDALLALTNTPYLDATTDTDEQVKRLRHIGIAQFRKGDAAAGEATVKQLEELLAPHKKEQDEAVAKAETRVKEENRKADEARTKAAVEASRKADAGKPGEAALAESVAEANTRTKAATDAETKAKKESDDKLTKAITEAKRPKASRVDPLQKALDELRGLAAIAKGDFKGAIELLKKAGGVDDSYIARVQLQGGLKDEAEKTIKGYVDGRKNEVHPLAVQVDILWQLGKKDDARKAFDSLRKISGTIDRDFPPFARLDPIGKELGFGDDWRVPLEAAKDTGVRPELASLGPIQWKPMPVPSDWALLDSNRKPLGMADFRGKPTVVIFYLGFGCLHCVEQLKKFAPRTKDFTDAGIQLVAISTDRQDDLTVAVEGLDKGPWPFPLAANHDLDVFRQWRVYDDFEKKPLHGTFLVDGDGTVRWLDVSFEPFMDVDFLLGESKRLIGQSAVKSHERPMQTPLPMTTAAPAGSAR